MLCGLLSLVAGGVLLGAEPPAKPRIPVNLITNPDFELDANRDGMPDGWFHSEPQYWCGPAKNSKRWRELRELWVREGAVPANIPFRSPKTLEGGTYRWEASGLKSGHCISIDETTKRRWGEWDTVVAGIKPKTDYVILGWRKQSARAGRKVGAPPWMKVAVFGKMTPVKGTIDRGMWVPFALSVNSGRFEGKCRLGFVVEQAPTKLWVDRVAMFEGRLSDIPRFRVGRKGALLEYPFHSAAYASPDLECPLFFDILWSFHGANGDPALEVVVDLPDGLGLAWAQQGAGLRLSAVDPKTKLRARPKPITIEGRPYLRWSLRVVSARDRSEFDSAGKRAVRLWVEPRKKLAETTFEAFYHARWRGGSQPVQPLNIKLIRIPKVRQPKADVLMVGVGGLSTGLAVSRTKRLIGQLSAMGVNCALFDGALPAKVAGRFEKAGITPGAWFALGGGKLPPDAVAKDIKGRPVPGMLCPSYDSKDALKTVFAEPVKLVKGGTRILLTDLRDRLGKACYCPKCVKKFEDRCVELKFVPPVRFEAEPGEHEKIRKAWQTFRSEWLNDLYGRLRRQLDLVRKDVAPAAVHASAPKILALLPTPALGLGAPGQCTKLDYKGMGRLGVNLQVIEPDMNLVDAGGTPAWVGDEVARLVEMLPSDEGTAGVLITAGSCESRAAMAPVARRSDVRDQVLEAVVAGAKAVILRPFYAVDGKDIQQFAEAVRLLVPFEEIIRDGKPIGVVRVAEGRARARSLGEAGRMLVLVSDYSAKPADAVKLGLTFPKDFKRPPMVLVDVESAAVVAKVPPTAKHVNAPLNGSRARLFYLGPRAKLPELRPKK